MSSQSEKIEGMLIMAKDKTGRALEDIIDRVLTQPQIFVFGEFLDLPNVQQLGSQSKHLKTLNLFAYGTITEYKRRPGDYLQLKEAQLRKLELITIADMASKQAVVPYDSLKQVLGVQDIR